ncbi:unnamed protein product [Rhizophagus irregularis]|nr:unnamed protein product [Rhizophagus irregularis]
MASLCRKPKLLSSLQEILNIVNITSHTLRHERNLEKIRALLANPTDRIHYNENIWNLGIIDNVDFKKSTFGYENIFDATRGHSHAILRMLFQFQMPESLNTLELQERAQNQQPLLFGQNSYSEQTLNIFNSVFEKLLAFDENTFTYQTNFDGYDIRNQIMIYYKIGCDFPSPNIIILDAGDPPSNDLAVHECLKMYQNEIDSEYINVVADEAIFRRNKEELKLRIRATQLEKDRTDMLLCDYIGDNVKSSQQRNVQSRKNKVWELAHLLIDVFESLDPFNHPIFEFCKNLNQEEINQLVTVYDIGIKKLQSIIDQEILLTEDYTTVGRRARNINRIIVLRNESIESSLHITRLDLTRSELYRITVAEIARMKKEKKEEEREEKRKEKENKRGKGRGRGRGRDRGRGRGKRRGRGKDRGSGSEKE